MYTAGSVLSVIFGQVPNASLLCLALFVLGNAPLLLQLFALIKFKLPKKKGSSLAAKKYRTTVGKPQRWTCKGGTTGQSQVSHNGSTHNWL